MAYISKYPTIEELKTYIEAGIKQEGQVISISAINEKRNTLKFHTLSKFKDGHMNFRTLMDGGVYNHSEKEAIQTLINRRNGLSYNLKCIIDKKMGKVYIPPRNWEDNRMKSLDIKYIQDTISRKIRQRNIQKLTL